VSDRFYWYPWYVGEWMSSGTARAMTLEQRGLFRELLDHQWNEGSLPADETQLQRLASATPEEFSRSWPIVKQRFTPRKGRLCNGRLEEIRKDQLTKSRKQSAAAKKAAKARWNKHA
jgi:uncharacterized protein YdaU (DUF1376 family)